MLAIRLSYKTAPSLRSAVMVHVTVGSLLLLEFQAIDSLFYFISRNEIEFCARFHQSASIDDVGVTAGLHEIWLLAGRKLSSLFLVSASVCASLSLSERQLLEFVNPTSEKMACREKQRCLPVAELDKHLYFSDSKNKSNKERNPLMNSSLASLHPAHLMLK